MIDALLLAAQGLLAVIGLAVVLAIGLGLHGRLCLALWRARERRVQDRQGPR
jgi:hypothetical protein